MSQEEKKQEPLKLTDFDWIGKALEDRQKTLDQLAKELEENYKVKIKDKSLSFDEKVMSLNLYALTNHLCALEIALRGVFDMIKWVSSRKEEVKVDIPDKYVDALSFLQEQMLMWKRGLESAKRMTA